MKWSIPDGFEVADEPAELNASLVDSHVYMRWEKYASTVGSWKKSTTSSHAPPRDCSNNTTFAWFGLMAKTLGPAKLSVENDAFGVSGPTLATTRG